MALAGYVLRRARPSDLEQLVVLQLALQDHLEAANRDLWRMGDEARGQVKAQLAGRLTAQSSCVLVAEHAHVGLVGVIYGRVITNTRYIPSRVGTVDQVFVQPEHRRNGVGSRLVHDLCEFFARQGVDDLSLRYVAGNDEAAHFWAALGFTPRIVTLGATRELVEARLSSGSELDTGMAQLLGGLSG